jgi:hypothetical protein
MTLQVKTPGPKVEFSKVETFKSSKIELFHVRHITMPLNPKF